MNEILNILQKQSTTCNRLANACLCTENSTKHATEYLDLNNFMESNLSKSTDSKELF